MPASLLHEYFLGDMTLRYVAPSDALDAPGLVLIPSGMIPVQTREFLDTPCILNLPEKWPAIRAWEVDPLVHVSLAQDPRPEAFAQGRTMRGGIETRRLRMTSHGSEQLGDGTTVIRTVLKSVSGLEVTHEVEHRAGDKFLVCRTSALNTGATPLTLELLTAFSMGGITPFAADDASGRLWIHRFRSAWSNEGRFLSERAEELLLEPSWPNHGVRCERFGTVGSYPVNGWFPCAAVEDRQAGVTWAANLVVPGAWQVEFYRRADQMAFSGGWADYEMGHWRKVLSPGETLVTPDAWLTVAEGGPEIAFSRLREAYRPADLPTSERDYPVVFNEWCTSWGSPTHDNLVELASRLRGTGIRYLVIDDGWAERPDGAIMQSNGDWRVNRKAFPNGIKATADAIREMGLIPGIWFEFEVCNPGSDAWNRTAHLLHRDGQVLQVGSRRFWDFRDPWVHEYLGEKVAAFLRENGLGYLKVDYNDNIGLGCDGPESQPENLRLHLDGVLAFFDRLRKEMPDLVIENCSSGSHRASAAFVSRTVMTSFSDSHETPNIPVIAANLNLLLPPSRSQIWAVVRALDSVQRLYYSLAATFLGRMCLSGEVLGLSNSAWDIVVRAIDLHGKMVRIIAGGEIRRHGAIGPSYNAPSGWQGVTFQKDGEIVVVLHSFANAPQEVTVPLEPGIWQIGDTFAEEPEQICVRDGALHWTVPGEFAGAVVRLRPMSQGCQRSK